MKRIALATWLSVAAGGGPPVCLAAAAAEVLLGSREFYPSPERPVGWRGDGSGAFPGATPVTQWSEGSTRPVTWKSGPHTHRGVEIVDGAGRNIVWKTEMPGFANSSPIVVGDRVFTTAEPDLLCCADAHTGKILWRQSLSPFELLGQSPDEVSRNTTLLEAAYAVNAVVMAVVGNYTGIEPSRMTPEHWRTWRGWFAEARKVTEEVLPLDPRGGAKKAQEQIDAVLAELDGLLKGKGEGTDLREAAAKLGKMVDGVSSYKGRNFMGAWMNSEFGLHPYSHWDGWEGWTFPTPVSDGRRVYVSMGRQQVGCFDLSGRRIWARVHPSPKPPRGVRIHYDARADHLPSPLLIGEVLVVQLKTGLVGLDKATGRTLWEAPVLVGSGYRCGTHRRVRVRGGGDVIACTDGKVLSAATGKVLCDLGAAQCSSEGGGCSLVGGDGYVVFQTGRTNNPHGMCRFDLTAGADGAVTFRKAWGVAARGGNATSILYGRWLLDAFGNIFDVDTGKRTFDSPGRQAPFFGRYVSPILAGQYLVSFAQDRRNPKGQIICSCTVGKLGPEGTAAVVSRENILGGENKPRIPALERFLPEAYRRGLWSKSGATPDHFGYGSPFAQGNRIFYRSCSHLYCIGDPGVPYDWNPASRRRAEEQEAGP